MAWSKSTRIKVMLVIDIVFFLIELIVGMRVGSLALMADAFHMLNDIISLFIGLWAVEASKKETTDRYSYGFQRAEILGAYFNAVFLIALCVSILLESLNRFIDPPTIDNPKLILIVGCCGLVSNFVGLVVLGGHGHSHGPGDHSHGQEPGHSHAHNHVRDAEEGRAHFATDLADENRASTARPTQAPSARQAGFEHQTHRRGGSSSSASRRARTPASVKHSRLASIEDIATHPASFRQDIIDASRATEEAESTSDSSADEETAVEEYNGGEETPLLNKDINGPRAYGTRSIQKRPRRSSEIHRGHNHTRPKKAGSGHHGHSHGDMGMNALVLHVMGDALGNVGVIATALIIWLTDWSGKHYADPAVSLFIALIILKSAVPLTIATSKILLQATPTNIEIGDIKADIEQLDNIENCHHIHVWQLSDSQIVASLHILLKTPISNNLAVKEYMQTEREVRKCLHAYGIHSSVIQPEFCTDMKHVHGRDTMPRNLDGATPDISPSSTCGISEENVCLMDCVDGCLERGCCTGTGSRPESSHSRASSHNRNHDHDHSHDDGHHHD